jgi:hypothetical protein
VRHAAAILIAGAGLCLATGPSNAEGAERQRAWWFRAQQVLFTDLELSPEQARAVDAIIETQLAARARLQDLDAELRASQERSDEERAAALRVERRATRAQLEDLHELIEAMRALLAEAQRPTFDMNRARLLAEGQRTGESPPRSRPERSVTDAEGKAE